MNDVEFHDSVVASLATLEANASAQTQALARLERVLLIGNGQPSIVDRLARVEERSAPTKAQVFGLTGALTVFLTVATEFIKGKIGAQ